MLIRTGGSWYQFGHTLFHGTLTNKHVFMFRVLTDLQLITAHLYSIATRFVAQDAMEKREMYSLANAAHCMEQRSSIKDENRLVPYIENICNHLDNVSCLWQGTATTTTRICR